MKYKITEDFERQLVEYLTGAQTGDHLFRKSIHDVVQAGYRKQKQLAAIYKYAGLVAAGTFGNAVITAAEGAMALELVNSLLNLGDAVAVGEINPHHVHAFFIRVDVKSRAAAEKILRRRQNPVSVEL